MNFPGRYSFEFVCYEFFSSYLFCEHEALVDIFPNHSLQRSWFPIYAPRSPTVCHCLPTDRCESCLSTLIFFPAVICLNISSLIFQWNAKVLSKPKSLENLVFMLRSRRWYCCSHLFSLILIFSFHQLHPIQMIRKDGEVMSKRMQLLVVCIVISILIIFGEPLERLTCGRRSWTCSKGKLCWAV